MNLFFYLLMVASGFIGTLHELLYKRTNYYLLGSVLVLYVITMCSRIGFSDPEKSDLNSYLEFFEDAEETYFELGYLFITNIARNIFGKSPYVLISTVDIWIIAFVMLAAWLSGRQFKHVIDREEDDDVFFYPTCFFFIFSLYWGSHFGSETLRIGMATSLLYCSCALAVNSKMLSAFIIALVTVLFHTSAIVFAIFVLVLYIVPNLNLKWFSFVFTVLLILDVLLNIFNSYSIPYVSQLFEMMSEIDEMTHYAAYSTQEASSYFDTQYLTYHILGFAMLFGDLSDSRYNKAVQFYYVGLAFGTFFQSILVVMRLQWLFLAMVVLVLYYFVINDRYSLPVRLSVLSVFSVIQQIMLLRVLGWHL